MVTAAARHLHQGDADWNWDGVRRLCSGRPPQWLETT